MSLLDYLISREYHIFILLSIIKYLDTIERGSMQFLNTKGAANKLGCSENWIHKLVSRGKVKAYIYNEQGALVERKPENHRQGQGLYFLESDLETYQPETHRRPRGSKDKIANNPKRRKRTTDNTDIVDNSMKI
jgi:hypothetical protein